MKENIIKFPRPLKENKNNDLIPQKQQKISFERNIPFKKPRNPLTKEELEDQNRVLQGLIGEKERKIDLLSKNDKINDLFNVKAFISDHYKDFMLIIADLKSFKTSENKQKERREKLEYSYNQEIKRKNSVINSEKLIKSLEEKIKRLKEDVEQSYNTNKKYHELLTKKDFFREYDFMNKEVEGLKKQNSNLELLLKKLQNQEKS